jgi:hypothetical protein
MVNRRQLLKISALGTASFAAPLAYSASNITMAYNTGNAIGSTSPKDLSDNARNLDYLVNGGNSSYPDRKGVPRKSWKGMEGEHNADQIRRESEFDADQDNREVQFNAFMDASGYEPPIPYAPGILLDRTTKTVSYLGNEYRAKGSFIPMTTSNWATDEVKLKLIGDDSLRQEAANSTDLTKGATIFGWLQETGEPGNTGNELRKAIRTSQFTQNAAGLQKAVNQALLKGRPLEVDSSFDCLGTTINIATPLTICGHGTLTNCVLKLGVAGVRADWFKRLYGFTLSGAASKILIHSGRHIRIACNFTGCTNGIHGQVVVGTSGFHDVGYIDYTGSTFVACTKDVFLENATPAVLVFNDFQATDFVSSFASQYHIHAQQIDGINVGNHVVLMERNKPTENAFFIQNCEWVNFTGAGNIFECGKEGILLEEVGSVNIGGAMTVAFVGQQAIKSALRIVNTTKFALIHISGFKGEKPSGHIIDISAAVGWAGLVSDNSGTVDLRTGSGANQTYFGAAPLNSVPHYLVKTDSTATRALVTDNQGTHIDGAGLSTLLEMSVPGSFVDPHHAVQHTGYDCFKRTVAVAGPSITIMRLEDSEGSQATFGGIITMVAKNAAGTKSATYQLSVSGLSVALISEIGSTTGAAADDPSFDWSISATKTLQASRKNITSGTFDFYATCVGDVRLRA